MGCNSITRVKSFLLENNKTLENISTDEILSLFGTINGLKNEIIDSYIELYEIDKDDFEAIVDEIEDYSKIDPDFFDDAAADVYNSVFDKKKKIKNKELIDAIKLGSINSVLFSVKNDITIQDLSIEHLKKDDPSMYGLKDRKQLNTFKRGLERLQSGTTLTKPQKEYIEKVTKFLEYRSENKSDEQLEEDNNDSISEEEDNNNDDEYKNFNIETPIDTDIEGITINLPASGNYTYEKGDTYGRMVINAIDESINSSLGSDRYIGIFDFPISETEDEIITASDFIEEVNGKIINEHMFSNKEVKTTLQTYDKILTLLKKNNSDLYEEFTDRIDVTLKQYKDTLKEEKEEKEEEPTNDNDELGEYELKKGIFANEDQKKAIDKVKAFFHDLVETSMLIKGRGGVGKTATINKAVKNLGIDENRVFYVAPRNKSKKVLQDAVGSDTRSYFFTVSQLLSMEVKEYYDNAGVKHTKIQRKLYNGKPSQTKFHGMGMIIPRPELVIIDEASMLNQIELNEILREARLTDTKVIFMGDNVQLAPIGDANTKYYESPVFEYHNDENIRVELKQIMRQKEDSNILPVTNEFAEAVESRVKDGKLIDNGEKGHIPKFDMKDTKDTSYRDKEPAINEAIEDFKENPKGTRWIMFNNNNNPKGRALVHRIKKALFGKNYKLYEKDEQLYVDRAQGIGGSIDSFNDSLRQIVKDTFDKENLPFVMSDLSVGDEITVVKYHDKSFNFTTNVDYFDWSIKQRVSKTVTIPVKMIEFTKNEEDSGDVYLALVPDGDLTKRSAQQQLGKYQGYFLNNLLYTSSAYVLTTEKSQGSTYDKVYADIGNIFEPNKGSTNRFIDPTAYQSAYVATSRPRNELVIVDVPDQMNKNIGTTTVTGTNESYISRIDKLVNKVRNSKLHHELIVAITEQLRDIKKNNPSYVETLEKTVDLYLDNSRNDSFKTIKKLDNGTIIFKDGKTTKDFNSKEELIEFFKDFDDMVQSNKGKLEYDLELANTLLNAIHKDNKGNFFPVKIELAPISKFNIGSTGAVNYKINKQTNKKIKDRIFFFTYNFGTDTPRTSILTHEMIHWFTSEKIHNDEEFRLKVRRLMNYVQDKMSNISKEHPYSFKDEHEFLATIGDDHNFRHKLHSIKVDGKTLLQKVTDLFKQFFIKTGIDAKHATALSEALTLVNEAMNSEVSATEIKLDDMKNEIMSANTQEEIIKTYNKYRRLGVSKDILDELKKVSKIRKEQIGETYEISSYSDGLEFALTNPTHTTPSGYNRSKNGYKDKNGKFVKWTNKQKWWIEHAKDGIEYNGKKYKDVEQAYKANKTNNDEEDYSLMVELIKIKLNKYPILIRDIDKKGGHDYLKRTTHRPTNGKSRWETGNKNLFIKALTQAYDLAKKEQDIKYSGDIIEYSISDNEIRFKDGSEYKKITSYEEMFKAMNEYEAAMSMKYNNGRTYKRSGKRREHVLNIINMISEIVPFREFDFNLYNVGSVGVYDGKNDTISMTQNKGVITLNGEKYFPRNLSEAVLHEYIHNITSLGIYANPKLRSQIRELMDLAAKVNPNLKKNYDYEYAFKNESEFIAELLSNQELFTELSKIKVSNTNVSSRIKNIFKYILSKLSKQDVDNVASSALHLFERAVNSRNRIGKKDNGSLYIKDDFNIVSGSDNSSDMYKPENDDQVEFDRKVNLGEYVKTLYMNFLQQDNTGDWKYVTVQQLTPEFIENVNNILDKMTEFWNTHQKDYEINLRTITASEDEKYDDANENRPTAGKHRVKINKITGEIESENIDIFWNPFQLNAAKSEIFLHETLHSLFQRAFSKEPKLGKSLEKLRNQMIKDGLDYTIFLEQNINSIKEEGYTPSETEIQIAKDKFNYIFGRGTDIEEFAAYVYSNSYIYNRAINTNFKLEKRKGFMGVVDAILYIIESSFGASKDSSKILKNTMEDIIKFRVKVLMEKEPETYKEALSFDTLKAFSPLFGKGVESIGAFIDAANKVGVPVNAKMIDGIKYLSNKIDNIIDSKTDTIKKVTKFITELPIIKQVMETGLLQSIYLDYFENTANGKYKDFYMRYRHGKALINKAVVDAKNSVYNIIKEESIFKSENYSHGYNYYTKIVATGLHKNLSKININNLTKEKLELKLEEYLKAFKHNDIEKDHAFIKHLDALAAYSLDGKSHIKNQQINVDNIINGYFMYNRKGFNQLSHKDYLDMVDMMEDYVSYKALSLMSDKELSDLTSTLNNEKILKEINNLNTMYNSHVNNYNKINRAKNNYKSFTQKPMGFYEFDSNDTPYNLALISEDDLNLVDTLRVSVVDKDEPIIILGKKYYKAKYSNIDVPFDEGMVSMVKYGSNGHSLSEIIRNHYLKNGKTNNNVDFEVDTTIRLLIKNDSTKDFPDMDKFIPEYDDNGRVIDYKLPISLEDKILHLESDSNIDSVIPHTISKMLNVSQSNRLNRNTVDYLNEFFAKNKNDKSIDFVNIKAMNSNNKLASVWNRLNPDIKKYINESTDNEGVMVPEELIPLIFGVKQASLSNLDIFGKGPKRTPIKQAIKLSESILMETLGFFKGALTLYNADIFIGNTISNMMVSWSYGISPVKYYKNFMKNWDLLTEFEKLNKIKIETQIQKSMGIDVSVQLAEIKRQMADSKFNDIVKDGQFTPLIDDMEATSDGYLTHKINDKFRMDKNDEQTKKRAKSIAAKQFMEPTNTKTKQELYKEAIKELTKDRPLPLTANKVRKVAYGLSGSKVNEFATKFVMYGDTLTRQMILDKRIDKLQKEKGRVVTSKEKQQILNELDMKLVNYGYNTNGLQSFTERVAGLFFTKYLFRAFKGYSLIMKQNPLSVVTQQLTQYGLDADVADPLDTYTKRGLIESLYNREQMKSPFGLAGNILSPNILMVTDFNTNTFVK